MRHNQDMPTKRIADTGAAPKHEPSGEGMENSALPATTVWFGLPAKLLVLTIAFVMLAEVLIFLPSIANFRVTWLTQRLAAAHLAALAATAAPGGRVPASVKEELLRTAQVRAVAIKMDMIRRLVLPSDRPLVIDASFDLRQMRAESWTAALGKRLGMIGDALRVFVARDDRVIRVYGQASSRPATRRAITTYVEIVLPEAPLKAAMIGHGLNILWLSIIISMIAAALVYFALIRVLVQPMMRLSDGMLHFSENPEDPARIIVPSGRNDEIGTAECELADMQGQLNQLLKQKNRLAQLGLAVSKVNHDLRNMLASAQLISDRLAGLPDPTVQRFAPKLIASLDRAINFCNSTLKFGQAEEAAPRRELFVLRGLVDEVGEGLDLPRQRLGWVIDIDPTMQIDADRDYLYRVLNNIGRNAVEAIEAQRNDAGGEIMVRAVRNGRRVVIEVSDTGPGVPLRAREHLFQPFKGGARKGGSGLGLAISAELVRTLGGSITLMANGAASADRDDDESAHGSDAGTTFRIEIPDRDVRGDS